MSALLIAAALVASFVFGFMCGAEEMHRKIKINLDEHRQAKRQSTSTRPDVKNYRPDIVESQNKKAAFPRRFAKHVAVVTAAQQRRNRRQLEHERRRFGL